MHWSTSKKPFFDAAPSVALIAKTDSGDMKAAEYTPGIKDAYHQLRDCFEEVADVEV